MNTIVPFLILVAALLCLCRFLRRPARTTSIVKSTHEPIPSPEEMVRWNEENDKIYAELVAESLAIDAMLSKRQPIDPKAKKPKRAPEQTTNSSSQEPQSRKAKAQNEKVKIDLEQIRQNSLQLRQSIRDSINELSGPLRDRLMKSSLYQRSSVEKDIHQNNLPTASSVPQPLPLLQEIKSPKPTVAVSLRASPLRIVAQFSKIVVRPVVRFIKLMSAWFWRKSQPADPHRETPQRRAA